jgi:hypothetical protein
VTAFSFVFVVIDRFDKTVTKTEETEKSNSSILIAELSSTLTFILVVLVSLFVPI